LIAHTFFPLSLRVTPQRKRFSLSKKPVIANERFLRVKQSLRGVEKIASPKIGSQ
jgi:hypothetical protein